VKVLDTSALLAYIQGEAGADLVEGALDDGAVCSAANWSEVMQKELDSGRDWAQTRALLFAWRFSVEPVTIEDAEWAAKRWKKDEGLSIADRLCLALGHRLNATVLTADSAGGESGLIQQIR
jgi:PIN domain nuclease of toxin-antitoxin system